VESIASFSPPFWRADRDVNLTSQAALGPLSGIIELITVWGADHEDVQIGRRAAGLALVSGGP
jgi:hypothetical protein